MQYGYQRENAMTPDTLDMLNRHIADTLMATLDIRYVDGGDGYLVAEMPVDRRHLQPMGIVHGGATAALAESVGSAASAALLHGSNRYAVGMELSINHLRSIDSGTIRARAEAIHLGRSTHIWEIRMHDGDARQIAYARLMMMVMERD